MSELIMREVVCATADCGNEGIPIELILRSQYVVLVKHKYMMSLHHSTKALLISGSSLI